MSTGDGAQPASAGIRATPTWGLGRRGPCRRRPVTVESPAVALRPGGDRRGRAAVWYVTVRSWSSSSWLSPSSWPRGRDRGHPPLHPGPPGRPSTCPRRSTWPTGRPTRPPWCAPATPASRCSPHPAPARVLPVRHLREQPHRQRHRPADAGTPLHLPGGRRLADRADQRGHAPVQGGFRALQSDQHLPAALDGRPDQHGGAGLGVGVSLRPDLPVRGRIPVRRGRAEPEPGRLPEHRGLRGLSRRPGAGAAWTVLGAPAGAAVLAIRYSNVSTPPFSPTGRQDQRRRRRPSRRLAVGAAHRHRRPLSITKG